MVALKRHAPLAFVPIFFMVKVTAVRPPKGTVELATNESDEVPFKYPTAFIFGTRSGRPESAGVVVPLIWYVALVFVPAAVATFFGEITGEDATGVELASPKEIVSGVVEVGTTESVGAGLKSELKETTAAPTPFTTVGTKRVE